MPTVPRRQTQVVPERATPSVRVSPQGSVDDFGGSEAPFRAAQQLAGTGIRIAQFEGQERERQDLARQKYFEEQKQQIDNIVVRDSALELTKTRTRLEVEAKQYRGRNAGRAPEVVYESWEKEADKIRGNLSNQEQKLAFDALYAYESASLVRSVQIHVANEFERHDDQQTKASVQVNTDDASLHYMDEGRVKQAKKNIVNELSAWAKRKGLKQSDPAYKEIVAKSVSSMHRDVLTRMIIDNQDDMAREYANENSDDILTRDMGVVARARKEAEISRAEVKSDRERSILIGIKDNEIGMEEIDAWWRSGEIDNSFYEKAVRSITQTYDDDTIGGLTKGVAKEKLIKKALKLNGFDTDDEGNLIGQAEGNSIEDLREFYKAVIENKPKLKKKDFENLVESISKDYLNSRSGNIGFFNRLGNVLRSLPVRPVNRLDVVNEGLLSALSILKPGVPKEDAEKLTNDIAEEAINKNNPSKTRYKKGQVISAGETIEVTTADGETRTMTAPETLTVIGYKPNGMPIIEPGVVKVSDGD